MRIVERCLSSDDHGNEDSKLLEVYSNDYISRKIRYIIREIVENTIRT